MCVAETNSSIISPINFRRCVWVPAFAGTTIEYTFAFSRHVVSEVLNGNLAPLKSEGAGKTGCAPHPRSRRQCATRMAPTSIQVWRKHAAFPAQWFYGLY